MLGGLALKWRWRQKVGKGWEKRTPNLVMTRSGPGRRHGPWTATGAPST